MNEALFLSLLTAALLLLAANGIVNLALSQQLGKRV